jgi:2-amino-4-hydroxy-6-hydroxymethyldihydropteridine diphosphokinase
MHRVQPAQAESVWLMLGSNQGDAIQQIQWAIQVIQDCPDIQVLYYSKLFVTRPVLVQAQPNFINLAMQIKTALSPVDLLKILQKFEQQAGRDRTQEKQRYGPRILDIDILSFGALHYHQQDPDLILPHPQLTTRAYVKLILNSMQDL